MISYEFLQFFNVRLMHTTAHIYTNNAYSVFINSGRLVIHGKVIRRQFSYNFSC